MKNNNLWSAIIDDMPRKPLYENADGIYNEHIYKYGFIQSIDFDQYCGSFCKDKKQSPIKSVDTIGYSRSNKCLYLIEFKDINKDFEKFKNENPNIDSENEFKEYRKKYTKYKKDGLLLKASCSLLLILNKCQNIILDVFNMNKKYFVFCKFPTNSIVPKVSNWLNNAADAQKSKNITPYGFIFLDFKDSVSIDCMDRILDDEKIQLE